MTNLKTNVMHATRLVLVEERLDWTLVAHRVQQLNLRVVQLGKNRVNAMLGLRLK